METPQLPPDLEKLERLLAGRERPEPSADLRERVIRRVEAELLQAELPPQRANGWWGFAVATAASVALLVNLSLSAAHATSYDLRLAAGPQSLDASLRQIRELLPELSRREAMPYAMMIQADSNLARCPDVATGDPVGRTGRFGRLLVERRILMGYALLWTVALGGELLLLATLMACIGRLRRPRIRAALSVLVALTSLSACIALIGAIEWAKTEWFVADDWGRPMWFLTFFYAVGASWILFRGLRPSRQRPEVPGAAIWHRGKLALALATAVALYMMTTWNLDVAVQQRVAALRVEAGALAASAAPVRIPDRDNAAVIYRQAHELMPSDESWDEKWIEWPYDGLADFDTEDAKLREFLETQGATMRLVHQASEKPGCCFDHDWVHPGIDVLVPGLVSIRAGSRLLALNARSRAAAGDLRTALADTNAMFAMAEHAGSEPALLGVMVAASMDHMAFATLEAVLTSGEASADELALLDISDTVSYQRHFDRALWMEEAVALATYCDFGATFRFAELLNTRRPSWEGNCLAPLYRVFVFDDDLASYREVLRKCRQLADQPYYRTSQSWQSFEKRLDGSTRGLMTNLIVPGVYRVAERTAEADARRRLARLAVAVSRYRVAEDQFPETLDSLVPEFLPALPLDPFDGNPLRIKTTDQELVLYSVGPDGADDDGAPSDGQARAGDLTFRLSR